MTIGSAQSICGIQEVSHLCGIQMQDPLEHVGHLFLACIAITGDGHLDFSGCVFGDGEILVNGSGYGNSLRTPQLEHTLHVLAKERSFDGHAVGMIGFDDTRYSFEHMTELCIRILGLAQVNNADGKYLWLRVRDLKDAVSHDTCTGVYAQYHMVG